MGPAFVLGTRGGREGIVNGKVILALRGHVRGDAEGLQSSSGTWLPPLCSRRRVRMVLVKSM